MEPARASSTPTSAVVFHDGLGERRRTSEATGEDTLELLCLRRELTAIPSFEFALRERASRLANFRHTYFGRVRSVDRLNDVGATLAIASESTRGIRLSHLLTPSEKRPVTVDINAALHLLRQIVSAVAMLHESDPDIAHGAIGPERIIVTPNARVVIVEYVLGAALEQLHLSTDQYWRDLRVALPPSSDEPRFDQRADVTQLGIVGLSLILGRLLTDDEYPTKIREVLSSAWAISSRGGLEPLPPGLRSWLSRALQLDPRHAFASALDAQTELDRVLSGEDEIEEETAASDEGDQEVEISLEDDSESEEEEDGYTILGAPDAATDIDVVMPVREAPVTRVVPPPAAAPPAPVVSVVSVVTPPAPMSSSSVKPMPAAAPMVNAPAAVALAPTPVFFKPAPPSVVVPPSMLATPPVHAAVVAPPSSTSMPVTARTTTPPPAPLDVWTPTVPSPSPAPVDVWSPAPPSASIPAAARTSAKPLPPPLAVAALMTPAPKPSPRPSQPLPIPVFTTQGDDEELELENDMAKLPPPKPWARIAAVVVGVIVLSGGVYAAKRFFSPAAASAVATGQLSITSTPAGAAVLVDGAPQGATPVVLTLKQGTHMIELRGAGEPRSLPITMTAGAQMSQYVELSGAAPTKLGQLQVRTEPAGAQVSVDGIARGKSPVTVADLTPGQHQVVLESDLGTVKQTVAIEAATTSSLVVPLGATEGAMVSGWLSVAAPVDLQIFENKKLLGTSQTDRIMVAAGRHEIEIVNEPLGYRVVRTVQVAPGKLSPIKLEWPKGTIALQAVPWAEVWIDGEKVGETPIGNLPLSVGPHEIVFRHPDFGEQRHSAMVTVGTPARLSVDLRKKQ